MVADKDEPLFHIQTMQQVMSDSVATRRFQMGLLALFASVALMLAAVGIYGLVSYSVSQRTHEIGIRIALGAKREQVLRLVLRQTLRLAASGLVLGIGGALILMRFLSGLLFGVSPNDPLTFVAVSMLLTGVATAASFIPAWRAARVDPMVALRYE
jgi:putative ABC transport system permease protein